MANKDSAGQSSDASRSEARHVRRAERRPEMVKQRRERRRQEFERQKRNWLIIRAAGAAVVVILLIGAGWWGFRQWEEYQIRDDVTTYFTLDDYSIQHVEGELLYEQIPPVGGPHNGAWQNCGYYAEPIYNWHGVHSLEHGAVWLTYDPELAEDDIQQLQNLANQSYVLVSPYPGLENPVVGSVWGKQITFDGVDDDRLEPFIREYRLNPDNTPEPGAICSGNIDFMMEPGEAPQTEPAIISGPPEEVAAAEATAAAGGTPEGAVASPGASPAATPPATPMGDGEG